MIKPLKTDFPISQDYGDNITTDFHTGIDYACPEGTPVYAVEDGTIQWTSEDIDSNGWGKYIILRPSGTVEGRIYSHLSALSCKQYQEVSTGDLIGYTGNTGNSTGPHLHFECRKQWVDYKSHYKPMFTDEQKAFISKPLAEGTASAVVVSPMGANMRDDNLSYIGVLMRGVKVVLTGKKRTDDGITRHEVNIRCWLAVDDGETQILK